MRGFENKQEELFSYITPEARVPADHPLRAIRVYADEALRRMSRVFTQMYADSGRLSVPPETLLKSSLLMALYSVRSERLFCEMLEYNLFLITPLSARNGSGCSSTGSPPAFWA